MLPKKARGGGGEGAALGNQEIGGRWTDIETTSDINILELQAAFFALRAFCHTTNNTHVQLQIDNTTAVATSPTWVAASQPS